MLKFVTENTESVDHKILRCFIREDSYYVIPETSQSLKKKKDFQVTFDLETFLVAYRQVGANLPPPTQKDKVATNNSRTKKEKNGSPTYRSNCSRYFSLFRDVTDIRDVFTMISHN